MHKNIFAFLLILYMSYNINIFNPEEFTYQILSIVSLLFTYLKYANIEIQCESNFDFLLEEENYDKDWREKINLIDEFGMDLVIPRDDVSKLNPKQEEIKCPKLEKIHTYT